MLDNWLNRFGSGRRAEARPIACPRVPRFAPHLEDLEGRWVPAVDVILEWNDVMLQANAADHARTAPEQGGPILTGRAFAIVSAAMYDAYNSVERIGEKYLVAVPNATSADADAAVAQAAHDALTALFPAQRTLFDTDLQTTLARIRDGRPETEGRAVGAAVARQILAARANDGSATMGTPAYVANGLPGFHAADPLHPNQVAYGPSAGAITPFAVRSTDQFDAPDLDDGTPAGRLAFLQSQKYTDAYNEVFALGGNGTTTPTSRTAEQTEIGIYWAYDGRPGLGTPPRLYNQIVRTVAAQEHNTEAENARLFALVNIAMADAGFTAWDDKYDNDFWRPVMGLRNGSADGNPNTAGDATWTPLGAPASNPRPGETNFTPPFPAYTSGHATFGAAAFETLARFYGRDDISFSFTSDELNGVTVDANGSVRPLVTRTFDSFTEAKLENAQSRIYLGIHWAFDASEGIKTGDGVADYVFNHFLEPNRHGGHDGGHGGGGHFAGEPAVKVGNAGGTNTPGDTSTTPDSQPKGAAVRFAVAFPPESLAAPIVVAESSPITGRHAPIPAAVTETHTRPATQPTAAAKLAAPTAAPEDLDGGLLACE